MADDKTRLLGKARGGNPTMEQTGSSRPLAPKNPQFRAMYGTYDGPSPAHHVTDVSSTTTAERPPLQVTPQLHLTHSPLEPSVPTIPPLSSAPGTRSRNPPLHRNQNQTTINADQDQSRPSYSAIQIGIQPVQNPGSESGDKNDNSNSNINAAVAEQPTSSAQSIHARIRASWQPTPLLQVQNNEKTARNTSSFKTNVENQDIDQVDSRDLNNLQILNNLPSAASSSPTDSKPNNEFVQPTTAVPSFSGDVKLESDTPSPKGERSHLLAPKDMEFSGYVSDGRKNREPQDEGKPKRQEKTPFFVYYLACFATIGGLLFGYDTGIISGAMLLIKDYFQLSTIWQEAIVSGTVGAAAVFSLLSGFMCDYFGRKITIMIASVVFSVGAVIMGVADSTGTLLAGRIVVGVGIGFASMTVPVYVAEAAPPHIRGRLVTLNQLFITIGILISSVVAGLFSGMKTTGWRYMLGLAGVPGVIQFIGFFYLPESPRWLIMKGREQQATWVLQRIRGTDDVHAEIKEIMDSVEEDKKQEGFVLGRVIRTQHVRRALFVGCGLQVFQQLCGINTVIYYSATILTMAGFPKEAAIWLVLVPNSVNFLATFIGLALVERLGRRKLMIASFIGVVVGLAVLAVGFQLSAHYSPLINQNVTETGLNATQLADGCHSNNYPNCEQCILEDDCGFCSSESGSQGSCLRVQKNNVDLFSEFGRCQNETIKSALGLTFSHGFCPTDYTWMAVLGLALFVFAFSPGLGPMPWTINSEIYPMWARSTCTSIATGCNWICNLVVSLFFLTLTEAITKYGAFWLFGGICFIGLIFTIIFLPETKNKSLEEVEDLFRTSKKKDGSDNLGYERDAPTPAANGNTRL